MSRSGRSRTAACLTPALIGLLLCSCASPSVTAAPAGPAAGPTTAAAEPQDQRATPGYEPVLRHGKKVKHTVNGSAGTFSGTKVGYPDKVTVKITRVAHAVEKDRGPGTITGRPQTALFFTLTNGSSQPVDLSQVVVTTTYGSDKVAIPNYEYPSVRDFSGQVGPGERASATYAFFVPDGQASRVRTVVDFDGVHVPAVFTGSTK